MASPRMTEERWTNLRDYLGARSGAVTEALAEAERARANEAELLAFVRAFVTPRVWSESTHAGLGHQCLLCPAGVVHPDVLEHAPGCPVTLARAAIAKAEGRE